MTPRTPEERLIISTSVCFYTLSSSWSAFQMEPPAKLKAINKQSQTPLLFSFPFHFPLSFPFLSFKQTQTLFSSFLFPLSWPLLFQLPILFPLLHKSKIFSFLSTPFLFPFPLFFTSYKPKLFSFPLPFSDLSHFNFLFSFLCFKFKPFSFHFSDLTYYFLFPLTFSGPIFFHFLQTNQNYSPRLSISLLTKTLFPFLIISLLLSFTSDKLKLLFLSISPSLTFPRFFYPFLPFTSNTLKSFPSHFTFSYHKISTFHWQFPLFFT